MWAGRAGRLLGRERISESARATRLAVYEASMAGRALFALFHTNAGYGKGFVLSL